MQKKGSLSLLIYPPRSLIYIVLNTLFCWGLMGCIDASNSLSDLPSFDGSLPDASLSADDEINGFNQQQSIALVKGQAWVQIAPAQDPFSSDRHDRIPCDWLAFGVEYGGIEINTGRCGYLTLTQPLLHAVSTSTWLKVSAWHSPLLKGEIEGLAFFSLMIGDQLIWEKELYIPSDAISWEETFLSPVDIPQGTPVILNVRNHGANSWMFHSLQAWTP